MPGMPYHLEKGPLLSVLDDFFNRGPTQRLLDARVALRDPTTRLTDIGVFDSGNLYSATSKAPYRSHDELVAHFEEDWLGIYQPPKVAPTDRTGHWQFYRGPVQRIMRETLVRAIDLVLGIPNDVAAPKASDAKRHWPIDFWWKCPQPWFEGWISWRQGSGLNMGKVTVIFATPADDGVVLRDPTRESDPAPTSVAAETEGSWVVSARLHQQTVQQTVVPMGKGDVIIPQTWTVDVDEIVVRSPWLGSGGAVDHGHPYIGGK